MPPDLLNEAQPAGEFNLTGAASAASTASKLIVAHRSANPGLSRIICCAGMLRQFNLAGHVFTGTIGLPTTEFTRIPRLQTIHCFL